MGSFLKGSSFLQKQYLSNRVCDVNFPAYNCFLVKVHSDKLYLLGVLRTPNAVSVMSQRSCATQWIPPGSFTGCISAWEVWEFMAVG